MKKNHLQNLNAIGICTLLLVFLSCLFPMKSVAQPYVSSTGVTIGTEDSRLFASVYETDSTVTMKVMALGFMKLSMFDFSILYDPNVLRLTNSNQQEITGFGQQPQAATLSPDLSQWYVNAVHKDVGASTGTLTISGHETMRAIWLDCGFMNPFAAQPITVTEGEVQTLLECYFNKTSKGQDLVQNDFGLGISTSGMLAYQTKYGSDGLYLWYRELEKLPTTEKFKLAPELFMFRSGSMVKTNEIDPLDITPGSASIYGYFAQGTLPSTHFVLDTVGTIRTGNAKLHRDTVRTYGFIYSQDNVTISIDEFSYKMIINSTKYDVPSNDEILAGTFTRGNFVFDIIIVDDNDLLSENLTYNTTITGLEPNQQYYAWAYTHYTYEASNMFQAVGNRVTFSTSECIPLNIGAAYTVFEPACGDADGKIQMVVSGGSGFYEFSTDGINFQAYQNNIITGLTAGIYTIWVKDATLPCPQTSISNIILHNSTTDLFVTMFASNSANCDPNMGTGTLTVSVTGGVAPYTYMLNGNDVTSEIVNGILSGLPAGKYIMEVEDHNGCMASSGEVRINADNTNILVNITDNQNTTCGFAIGAITFTVSGTSAFTYKVDGYPAVDITGYVANTPIEVSELSAGVHYLHVYNDCGEKMEEFIITNEESALAFSAVAKKEILSCNGTLLPGSITLTATGNVGELEYSINGNEWFPFAEGLSTTILNLHYGIYRVEVRDLANDCTYEVNRITILRDIYVPINVETVYAVTEPDCGDSNGVIYISATGGSGSYMYSTDGINYSSNNIIGGLTAGTYTIWVKDANNEGCSEVSILNFVLHSDHSDLNVKVLASNSESCNADGTGTGSLTITVTGGTGDYTYFVNGVDETSNIVNGVLSGLSAGGYIIEVEDSKGCVAGSGEVHINLTTPTLFVVLGTETDATCGSSTGSYNFTVSGNNSFTYQLNGQAIVPVTYVGTEITIVLTGLSAGEHTLRVTDDCNLITKTLTITNGTNGFEFAATEHNEIVSCDGNVEAGSIELNVSNGSGNYEYSYNNSTWTSFSGSTVTIEGLLSGVYSVEVRDLANECTYVVKNITISRETSYGTLIVSPVATSPQTFCGDATLCNLQASGVGIHWYLDAEGGKALLPTEILVNGHTYYAAQSIGACESQVRTAVTVIIVNELEIEPPYILSEQSFCEYAEEQLTLADIATDGNTKIVWYDAAEGGNELPLTTPLVHNNKYYAALIAGSCESALRTEVTVTITTSSNVVVENITSPQTFCEGALIGNLAVPHNQIIWYTQEIGGTLLPENYLLENNETYWAAYKTGGCESSNRIPVLVLLTGPAAPNAPETQAICGKATLADLVITGGGIVWYDKDGNKLELTHELEAGETYWAAQSSADCEGERVSITITNDCHVVYGTMFPFVYTSDSGFDAQFPVKVALYNIPEQGENPFEIFKNPVQEVFATVYDGSVYIHGTPKNPGVIGATNNPGVEIDWTQMGREQLPVGEYEFAGVGEAVYTVGMFKFENLVPKDYILEIVRGGYITRWGVVTVNQHGMSLGHRELIAGDVNGDFFIDFSDITDMYFNISNVIYDANYDLNGNGTIDETDFQIMFGNINAHIKAYVESKTWLESCGY